MKNKIIMLMALAVISSISAALSYYSAEPKNVTKVIPAVFTGTSLTDDETESIKYMREEEKLARDVYFSMNAKYNTGPFNNIIKAEQTHMDLVKDLLLKYNIEDPVTGDETGSFTNSDIKELYTKFFDQGNISLIDALKAGALIEETDIADLDKQLKVTQNKDIKDTYEYLRHGSENHLRAFVRNLKANGIEYSPVILPKEDFDKIITAENNRKFKNSGWCNGKGNGRGNYGKGRGNGNGRSYNDGYGKGNGRFYNGDCPNNNWLNKLCPNYYR